MISNPTPLNSLKDLHLGPPVGVRPLAYGWYFVIAGIAILLALTIISLRNYFKNRRPKREALKQLQALEQTYKADPNPNKIAYQLTILLKRVCFAYYPRTQIASLHSEKWQVFLGNTDWSKTLCRLNYEKDSTEDISPIFKEIKHWIKTCDRRGKHA